MASVVADLLGGGVLKSVNDIIDHFSLSAEAKAALQSAAAQAQSQILADKISYQQAIVEAQSKIIDTEAAKPNILTATWRPITMLIFVGLICCRIFGLTSAHVPDMEYQQLWELVKLGLGGYVIGRSVEKITPGIVSSITGNK